MPTDLGYTVVQLPRDFTIAAKGTWAVAAEDGKITFWSDQDFRRVFQQNTHTLIDAKTNRAVSQELLNRIEAMQIPTMPESEPEPLPIEPKPHVPRGRPPSAWPVNPSAPRTSQRGKQFAAMWAAFKKTPNRPLTVADVRPFGEPENIKQLSARFDAFETLGIARRVPVLGYRMHFELTEKGIELGLRIDAEKAAAIPASTD